MKKFLFVLLILTIPILFSACGQEEKKVVKTIRVGMCMDFVPFEFIDEKERKVKGFDVDVMEAVGKELGCEVSFLDFKYDDLLGVLEKGNIDAVISAMNITDEKAARVNFTKPYYESGMVIATLEKNQNIKKFSDLPGKRVGTVVGTESAIEMREQKSIEVLQLPTTEDIFYSLLSGNVDAIVEDKAMLEYYLNTHEITNVKILPEIYRRYSYAIAVNKNDREFFVQMNNALQRVKEKGVYDKIYEKWFGKKTDKH